MNLYLGDLAILTIQFASKESTSRMAGLQAHFHVCLGARDGDTKLLVQSIRAVANESFPEPVLHILKFN